MRLQQQIKAMLHSHRVVITKRSLMARRSRPLCNQLHQVLKETILQQEALNTGHKRNR